METESSLAVPKETRRAALDGLLQLPTSRRMVEGLGLAFEALGLAPAALRPEDAAAMVSAWQRGLTVVLELSPGQVCLVETQSTRENHFKFAASISVVCSSFYQ